MSRHYDSNVQWQELCRDKNMVTAVKRWITYEVGDGSSVGAVVFRLGCQYFEDKVLGSFGFPQKQCISTWLWSFFGPSSLKHPQWHVSCCFPWECTLLLSHWISLTVKKYDPATISALRTPPIRGDFSLWLRSTQVVGPQNFIFSLTCVV